MKNNITKTDAYIVSNTNRQFSIYTRTNGKYFGKVGNSIYTTEEMDSHDLVFNHIIKFLNVKKTDVEYFKSFPFEVMSL